MNSQFPYDVFVSYGAGDAEFARELTHRLAADGLRVFQPEREFAAGAHISFAIDRALEESRVLLLIVSRRITAHEWLILERATFPFRDPVSHRKFVPVRVDHAQPQESLRQFAFIEWHRGAEPGYAAILSACRSTARDSAAADRPSTEVERIIELPAHDDWVTSIAMSADGRIALSASTDCTLILWDLVHRRKVGVLAGHDDWVNHCAISPNGGWAVSAGEDGTIRVWDIARKICLRRIDNGISVKSVGILNDGRIVAGDYAGRIRIWDADAKLLEDRVGHNAAVDCLSLDRSGTRMASSSYDSKVKVWDSQSGKLIATFEGHEAKVWEVAIAPSAKYVLSGDTVPKICLWNVDSQRQVAVLEGHLTPIISLAFSPDSTLAASATHSDVRLWSIPSGACVGQIPGAGGPVAFTRDGAELLTSTPDNGIAIWRLPPSVRAPSPTFDETTTLLTNAKVVLLGDSGVGKTSLGFRLAEDRFQQTVSSHGAWATLLRLPNSGKRRGVEEEIWLWDFGGNYDGRLVHQLYIEDVSLAVILFDPQQDNPFDAADEWARYLERSTRGPVTKLLVAARMDAGGLVVSRESIERFCRERGFAQYIETSARTGAGCTELREAIVRQIPWDTMPHTTSPQLFRSLKQEVLVLKDEGIVLLRIAELKQQLQIRRPELVFSLDDLSTVVALLSNVGVVWKLAFGDFVLLQPERVSEYAGALIRSVRAQKNELGCIAEENVLSGNLDYAGMQRVSPDDEIVVLRAMHQTLVDRGLCLREQTDKGPLLVLPGYFRRERPDLREHPSVMITYEFDGPSDEIYATLVVRLHHTEAFDRDRLWRLAADFKTASGKRLGLKVRTNRERAALDVYFDTDISTDVQMTFVRYIHDHLMRHAKNVRRLRRYACPRCHEPVENRRAVEKRLAEGHDTVFCAVCGFPVSLSDVIEARLASDEIRQQVYKLEEQVTRDLDSESRALILLGHAYAITGEAGQIFRSYTNADHGIDGEIEFKDEYGKASGKRLNLVLKSGDLNRRKGDAAEIFTIRSSRDAEYWRRQHYPVMLVVQTLDGIIRWMDITASLNNKPDVRRTHIVFEGEPFTAASIWNYRKRFIGV